MCAAVRLACDPSVWPACLRAELATASGIAAIPAEGGGRWRRTRRGSHRRGGLTGGGHRRGGVPFLVKLCPAFFARKAIPLPHLFHVISEGQVLDPVIHLLGFVFVYYALAVRSDKEGCGSTAKYRILRSRKWAFAPSLLPHAPGAMPSLNPGDPLESPGPAAQTPRQASSQDQSAKPTLASPSQPWPTKASQGLAGAREKLSIRPSALLRTTAPRHNVFTVWPVVQPPQQPPLDTLYLRRAVVAGVNIREASIFLFFLFYTRTRTTARRK